MLSGKAVLEVVDMTHIVAECRWGSRQNWILHQLKVRENKNRETRKVFPAGVVTKRCSKSGSLSPALVNAGCFILCLLMDARKPPEKI